MLQRVDTGTVEAPERWIVVFSDASCESRKQRNSWGCKGPSPGHHLLLSEKKNRYANSPIQAEAQALLTAIIVEDFNRGRGLANTCVLVMTVSGRPGIIQDYRGCQGFFFFLMSAE